MAQFLFAKDQEQKDASDVVESCNLDEKRKPPAQSSQKEPAPAIHIQVTQQGSCTKGREKQVVPGRHGSGIVGHGPNYDKKRNCGGGKGVHKAAKHKENGRHPGEEKTEEAEAQAEQGHSKYAEAGGMQVTKRSGVVLDKIAVWQLTLHHARGRLRKCAIVLRQPSCSETREHIRDTEEENESKVARL